jgi:hypothetical protein
MLSSPLLVKWKSNLLALGPRLNVLVKVVIRVLNQVAQDYRSNKLCFDDHLLHVHSRACP